MVGRVGTSCLVAPMRWLRPLCIHFWTAEVACSVPSEPVWPACWIDTPDRPSSSSSIRTVQDAWDVYKEELGVVPPDLVLTLRNEYDRSDVNVFWKAWSKGAEEGLFRAYCRAGWSDYCWGRCFLRWGCCSCSSSPSGWQVCRRLLYRIGGSHPTSLSLLSLVSAGGLLMCVALFPLSLFGLCSSSSKTVQDILDISREDLGSSSSRPSLGTSGCLRQEQC